MAFIGHSKEDMFNELAVELLADFTDQLFHGGYAHDAQSIIGRGLVPAGRGGTSQRSECFSSAADWRFYDENYVLSTKSCSFPRIEPYLPRKSCDAVYMCELRSNL